MRPVSKPGRKLIRGCLDRSGLELRADRLTKQDSLIQTTQSRNWSVYEGRPHLLSGGLFLQGQERENILIITEVFESRDFPF